MFLPRGTHTPVGEDKRVAQSHRCRRPRYEGCRQVPAGPVASSWVHLMGAPRKTKGWRPEREGGHWFPWLPACCRSGLATSLTEGSALVCPSLHSGSENTPAPLPEAKSSRDPDPHNDSEDHPPLVDFPNPGPHTVRGPFTEPSSNYPV